VFPLPLLSSRSLARPYALREIDFSTAGSPLPAAATTTAAVAAAAAAAVTAADGTEESSRDVFSAGHLVIISRE